jgi:acetolactate synthase-1/3 small subunit
MRRHIFVVQLEDQPGVLNRVVSLFRRRNFNIDSLTVGRAERPGVSRVTILFQATDAVARIVEANLYKLAVDRQSRSEILHLAEVFRARVVDVGDAALILEVTGSEEKINKACDVLRPYGVLELVRTGFVAMGRGVPGVESTAAEAAPRAREPDTAGLAMSV